MLLFHFWNKRDVGHKEMGKLEENNDEKEEGNKESSLNFSFHSAALIHYLPYFIII